jgi:hypothetical protein
MKKIILLILSVIVISSCKKTEFSPEGPTDVRVKNLTDMTFHEVTVTTSDLEGDTKTLGDITSGGYSEYSRVTKAYIEIEISAKVNIDGSMVTFSTGAVDFTYLHYIGQDRVTFVVYISDMAGRKLKINNRIIEEPLILK